MRLDTLFHWSPVTRRPAITIGGLHPGTEPTTCSQPMKYLCLGVDPRRAWVLSGGMDYTPDGHWDLWQVALDSEHEVRLRVEDGQLVEVKVHAVIPPSRLWLIGSREKAMWTARS
jgi:hypothetical protein